MHTMMDDETDADILTGYLRTIYQMVSDDEVKRDILDEIEHALGEVGEKPDAAE